MKSCSDISELEDNERNCSECKKLLEIPEVAKKLPSNLRKALSAVHMYDFHIFISLFNTLCLLRDMDKLLFSKILDNCISPQEHLKTNTSSRNLFLSP